MKRSSLGSGFAWRGGHLSNLGALAFSAFVGLGTTSPASAEAMFMGLGDLPGGFVTSEALAVSADGLVIVGRSRSASGIEAFRWENGVMTGLGDLPGGRFQSSASASLLTDRSSWVRA
jgi:probable HAF family extracellular repeat protein